MYAKDGHWFCLSCCFYRVQWSELWGSFLLYYDVAPKHFLTFLLWNIVSEVDCYGSKVKATNERWYCYRCKVMGTKNECGNITFDDVSSWIHFVHIIKIARCVYMRNQMHKLFFQSIHTHRHTYMLSSVLSLIKASLAVFRAVDMILMPSPNQRNQSVQFPIPVRIVSFINN